MIAGNDIYDYNYYITNEDDDYYQPKIGENNDTASIKQNTNIWKSI